MNILNKVTRKTLKLNKVRTMVTIIGIVLSAAMFTAVMTSVSSVQNYMLRCCEKTDGSWYALMWGIDRSAVSQMGNDDDIKTCEYLQNIGYADIGSSNEYKPYLFVGGMSSGFTDIVAVNITEGRMPENADEIILPRHLVTNGGVWDYEVGDIITLNIGYREWNGELLTQKNPFYAYDEDTNEEVQNEEKLIDTGERTFTVVGYYERPSFEPYSAPGYTALTVCDDSSDAGYDVFYQTKKAGEIYSVAERLDPGTENTDYNSDYLRYKGVSSNQGFNNMLHSMAVILSLLIMFGSVSLIYNAFSISVSERTKQFGILKSIGATGRQMRRSVVYEGVFLSIIGIPIGILAGILGMFITFKFTSRLFDLMLVTGTGVKFGLHVTWQSVVAATLICFVTVIISAEIPAVKAARRPAMEAIRQSADVAIKRNKVKTSRLTYKLFGFEGMLASKNFKRNKRKYRVTVISLFASIVLFISATAFCNYMSKGVEIAVQDYNYDISYVPAESDFKKVSVDELKNIISGVDGITKTTFRALGGTDVIEIDKELAGDEVISKLTENYLTSDVSVVQYFIDDDTYREYLESEGLDTNLYMNPEAPVAVAYGNIVLYSEKYIEINVFNKEEFTLSISVDREDKEFKEVKVGAVAKNTPMGLSKGAYVYLMYPFSAYETVMGEDYPPNVCYSMKSDNHNVSYEKLCITLDENGLSSAYVNDAAQSIMVTRAMVTILKVFSYGFIVLISLISLANVFNTIFTNIRLRRREFAMLKSVGMTKKGFNRMMNYECILYGMKGILYGLPVSMIIVCLMGRSMNFGVSMGIIIPWKSIAIAVASVFIVVFATMLYSMSKIRHDNTVETLKSENF